MASRKKKAPELTAEEALRRMFPARVVDEAKKAARLSRGRKAKATP